MTKNLESKLDAIMTALAMLSLRTSEIEEVMAGLHNNRASEIAQSKIHQFQTTALEEVAMPLVRQDPMIQQRNEPQVSLSDKFDGMRSKFQGFVNQIRLVTVLQLELYLIEESQVGLVGTLLTGQALSWFASLLENNHQFSTTLRHSWRLL